MASNTDIAVVKANYLSLPTTPTVAILIQFLSSPARESTFIEAKTVATILRAHARIAPAADTQVQEALLNMASGNVPSSTTTNKNTPDVQSFPYFLNPSYQLRFERQRLYSFITVPLETNHCVGEREDRIKANIDKVLDGVCAALGSATFMAMLEQFGSPSRLRSVKGKHGAIHMYAQRFALPEYLSKATFLVKPVGSLTDHVVESVCTKIKAFVLWYSPTQQHNEEEEFQDDYTDIFSGFHIDPKVGADTRENTVDYKGWVQTSANAVYVLPCYFPKCANRLATIKGTANGILLQIYEYLEKNEIEWRIDSNFPTLGFVLTFPPNNEELSLLVWFENKERTTMYIEIDYL